MRQQSFIAEQYIKIAAIYTYIAIKSKLSVYVN